MADCFPDYDVLDKRDTPSWNAATRAAIDARVAARVADDVLTDRQRETLARVIDRIVPQPVDRAPVNALALLIAKLGSGESGGFRHHSLPPILPAWRMGLDAIEAEARARYNRAFIALSAVQADDLLRAIENGDARAPEWKRLPPKLFWRWRLIPDIVSAYYAHPSAWSAMGFGGPAAPRGYVRLEANRRDPWEAAERGDGRLVGAAFRNRHAR